MGSYTPNYRLFKPGNGTGGDPTDDYVDVESQLDYNFSIIDTVGKKTNEYTFLTNTFLNNFPTDNFVGEKLISDYDHTAYVRANGVWNPTIATPPIWTQAAIGSGFINASTSEPEVSYYIEGGARCYLRGSIAHSSLAIWPQGTITTVAAAGAFPIPSATTTKEMITLGGFSASRIAQFYRVTILSTGGMTILKYGANAQTAGSVENYVSLSGLSYAIS